jgi:hypothetical protein
LIRKATAEDIGIILREHFVKLWEELGVRAQLSMPVDGRGVRVLARVPYKPEKTHITLLFNLNNDQIEVPIELSEDYERFRTIGRTAATYSVR